MKNSLLVLSGCFAAAHGARNGLLRVGRSAGTWVTAESASHRVRSLFDEDFQLYVSECFRIDSTRLVFGAHGTHHDHYIVFDIAAPTVNYLGV